MMDNLDSRALRLTDCYGQRFMKPGVYPYAVVPAHAHCVTSERPFTVSVIERPQPGTMRQTVVRISSEHGRLRAEPPEVQLEAGDLVLWNGCATTGGPFAIVGDKPFFASYRLVNESGYSHAFGQAGEYRWRDAYGSGAAGSIKVKDPGCREHGDFDRWRKALAQGTLVTITDARAEPSHVEILTGQTVFFAITKCPGISITDERLLDSSKKASHEA
jgi:plastocyanin